jgi:L-ribulokinase
MSFSLGIDYGTNLVRTIVADVADGRQLGSCVFGYLSGKHGILLDLKPQMNTDVE